MEDLQDALDLKSLLIPTKKAFRNPLSLLISDPAGEEVGWQEKYGRDEEGNLIVTDPKEREQNFKHWFGDSKVTDKGGEPLVVFHRGDFDELDDPIPLTSSGMHFGTKSAADERVSGKVFEDAIRGAKYTQEEDEEGNMRWWWRTDDGKDSFDYNHLGFDSKEEAKRDLHSLAVSMGEFDDTELQLTEAYLSIKNPMRVQDQGDDWTDAIKKAKAKGHDGIIYRNTHEDSGKDSYIIFDPTQAKSVHNRGLYNPADPNILSKRVKPKKSLKIPA